MKPLTRFLMIKVRNITSFLHVGHLVSCVVSQVDDDEKEIAKRKIWLTMRLSLLHKSSALDVIQEGMVLSAYTKGVEDHGFLLHFGRASFAGFMAKQNKSVCSWPLSFFFGDVLFCC